eukprot:6207994-Pleurochrysis_carterae.AAC.2
MREQPFKKHCDRCRLAAEPYELPCAMRSLSALGQLPLPARRFFVLMLSLHFSFDLVASIHRTLCNFRHVHPRPTYSYLASPFA